MQSEAFEIAEIFQQGCGVHLGFDAPEDGCDFLGRVVGEGEGPAGLAGGVVGYEFEALWGSGAVVSSGVGLC